MKKVANGILTVVTVMIMGGCANTSNVNMSHPLTKVSTSYVKILKQNCDANIAKDCNLLAYSYNTGKNIRQDYSLAVQYYTKAISLGDSDSYINLAWLFDKGLGIKKNYYMAAKLYEKASLYDSDKGVRNEARYNLGLHYSDGKGVKQSYFKAAKLYRKACDNKYYTACNNLGLLYDYGKGVRQSRTKAKRLYGKACDGGVNLGCKNYARLNR